MKIANIFFRRNYLRMAMLMLTACHLNSAAIAQLMTSNGIDITITGGLQMTVQGSVLSNAGTTISNSGTIDLSGDWINSSGNNCFGISSGTVVMNGANQNISGNDPTLFNNLTLTGTGMKTLFQDASTGGASGNGILSIGARSLDLNAHTLSVSNASTGAITYTTGMIISEKTDNASRVAWSIANTNGAHTIPFGNLSGVQIPFTINLVSGDIGNVTASTYATAPNNTPYPTTPTLVTQVNDLNGIDNSANMVDRFWEVNKSGGNTPVFDLTFTYAPAEIPANGNANMRAQHWNLPMLGWDAFLPGQFNPGIYSVQVPGATEFGPWVLTQEANPLPVTLLAFHADANRKKEVDLTWITASEVNNDYFTVEKSKDGVSFYALEKIPGAGNSTQELHYATADKQPYKGLNYYRLKQTDFDGRYSYSEIRTVLLDGDGNAIVVFPNPATNGSWILFERIPENADNISVLLYDATGNVVLNRYLTALTAVNDNSFYLERAGLANGIYFYTINAQDITLSRGKITFN